MKVIILGLVGMFLFMADAAAGKLIPEESIMKNNLVQVVNAIASGAHINGIGDGGFTPLILAIKYGSLEVAKFLADNGADINAKDESTQETALMWAAACGDLGLVNYLLERKADIKARDYSGGTALMCLANGKRLGANKDNAVEVGTLLIEKGDDVNAVDSNKQTALMIAAMTNNVPIVKLLIEKGADINMENDYKMDALMIAIANSSLETAKLLVDKGTKVNSTNIIGQTSLMEAAEGDFPGIAKLLIQRGADIDLKDQNGMTAFAIAEKFNHQDILAVLK